MLPQSGSFSFNGSSEPSGRSFGAAECLRMYVGVGLWTRGLCGDSGFGVVGWVWLLLWVFIMDFICISVGSLFGRYINKVLSD